MKKGTLKGETSLPDEIIKFTKYKWEFLRRNKKYIEDWEKLQECLEQKYGDWRPSNGQMTNEELEMAGRWKIDPISPTRSYEDLIEIKYCDLTEGRKISFDPHRSLYNRLFPENIIGNICLVTDGLGIIFDDQGWEHQFVKDSVAETGKIQIEVDLRYSKEKLLKGFEYLIDEWKSIFEREFKSLVYAHFCKERNIRSHPLKEKDEMDFLKFYKTRHKEMDPNKRKFHFDNFDYYLKVYDLRIRKISWKKIKEELKLNSIQTARNYYKAACELIEKGIDIK